MGFFVELPEAFTPVLAGFHGDPLIGQRMPGAGLS
jgi:hypothetical protein